MSPRRLNGWMPAQVTENVWDGDRLIRSTVTTESEWSSEQRDLLLAYDALMADVGPHGFRTSESTDPAANQAGSGWGFVADPEPVFDQVEIVRAQAREVYKQKHGKDVDLTGAIFRVRKVGDDG